MEFGDMTGTKRRGRKTIRQGGFTMFEFVLALSFLTIVGLMAVPSFQRSALNGNLKSVADALASDISNLRKTSMAENRMYRISLDIFSSRYTLQRCSTSGFVCPGYDTFLVRDLSSNSNDLCFDPGGTRVNEFYIQPRGLVSPGVVVLVNARGSMATLQVNATGTTRVRINLR